MAKGFFAVIVASVLYGVMPVFSKGLIVQGMNSDSVVVWRFTLATVFCIAIMLLQKISFRANKRQILSLTTVGIVGFGFTAVFLTLSYTFLPIGLATMFHFSYPILVILIVTCIDKQRVSPTKALCVLLTVAGVVLMVDTSLGVSGKGVVLALLSGLTYAVYVVSNRKLSFRSLNGFTSMFYVLLSSSVFFLVTTGASGQLVLPQSAKSWLYVVIIALFCTVISLRLLLYGIKILGAANASLLNMAEPLTSVVAGILVYGDAFTIKSAMGCVLIILSILFIGLETKRARPV